MFFLKNLFNNTNYLHIKLFPGKSLNALQPRYNHQIIVIPDVNIAV